jgi:lipopolysaccharide/colanic/teichoic acid biosynthesis glycosyltransferase
VVSAVLLLLLWPLFLFIGAAVVLTSKGGALYRQQRAGLGGRPFTFYKFRTMEEDAEENWAELISRNEQEGPVFKIADDPRITGVGRFLRRSSLDELPQLWNVLKGDMTLVGPRPPKVEEVSEYEPWQRQRLDVTGGLTCTWQVSGRSEIMFRDWMRMDINYVRSRGAWVDAKLLLRTVGAVLTGRGAY